MASPKPDPSKPFSKYRHKAMRADVVLPAEGCTLPAPPLPKGRSWSAAEKAMWRELWRSPQAVKWDESYVPTVAGYVVHQCAVLDGSAGAWQAQEARYAADRLGLSPAALLGLGWRIADPGEDAAGGQVVELRAVGDD